jgi:hypothetical protein
MNRAVEQKMDAGIHSKWTYTSIRNGCRHPFETDAGIHSKRMQAICRSTNIKSLTGLKLFAISRVIARRNYRNQTAGNDVASYLAMTEACSVRNIMLVENVAHPVCVVPLGTKCMNNISSLTGRRMNRDIVSSTNIKSLTGLISHVIARHEATE